MRGCTFPDPYWVEVPFLNKETGLVEIQECPVLLPHEVLAYFVEKDASRLSSWMPTPAHGVIHNAVDWCNKFGEDMRSMIPLGLHGDGVPFASKMRDSLECISWNILTDASGVRILFTTFPKSFLAGRETWDALLGTFAWSVRMLLVGVMPSSMHDGKPWKDNDVARPRLVANPWDLLQVCCRFEGTGPSTKRFSNFRAGNPNNVAGDAVQKCPRGSK